MKQRRLVLFCTFFAFLLIAGCADFKRTVGQNNIKNEHWSGRLSLRTLGKPQQAQDKTQTFQGAFELQGNAQLGDLRFLTPLGSTAAWIRWNPQGAELLARGETRRFDSLAQLVSQAVGADLPIAALFAWLRGQEQAVDGWQVDLSGMADGKIAARRTAPESIIELRLVLDLLP